MPKKDKTRHWSTILYPESWAVDWDDVLEASGLRAAVSPVHDADTDPRTGEVLKPHYHVIMCWDGPTTYDWVKKMTDRIGGIAPQPVMSVGGYYRYLTHADQAHKVKYSPADVRHFGGFDPADYLEEVREDKQHKLRLAVMAYIVQHNLDEYADLLERLRADERGDALLRTATTQTVLFRAYLDSRRNRGRRGVLNPS
jgi:hypothetical protein